MIHVLGMADYYHDNLTKTQSIALKKLKGGEK
jgi:hypothetical protein